LIDVGSLDFTTVATEIGKPHVVHHDEDDVRALRGVESPREAEEKE
jgi:hypothetical protein